jgi:hypothetical protein
VKARRSAYVLAVIGVDRQGPEDPRVALRRIIGGVTVVAWALAGLSWLSSGSIDWTLVGFAGAMWGAYSFLTTIVDTVGGLVRFVGNQFTGNVALPVPQDTIDDQTARFERMLAEPLDRHHEILIGIRLAEIYRTHQSDEAKSTALLDRLRAKFPDATELFLTSHLGM